MAKAVNAFVVKLKTCFTNHLSSMSCFHWVSQFQPNQKAIRTFQLTSHHAVLPYSNCVSVKTRTVFWLRCSITYSRPRLYMEVGRCVCCAHYHLFAYTCNSSRDQEQQRGLYSDSNEVTGLMYACYVILKSTQRVWSGCEDPRCHVV